MSPFLQASLLGGDDPSTVGSTCNRMFALRFAPTGNFWGKNSSRGPGPQFPSWVPDSQGKPQQELTGAASGAAAALPQLCLNSLRARAGIQQERTALVSVQGKERPFVTSLPRSVTPTATGHPEVLSAATSPMAIPITCSIFYGSSAHC